MHLAMQALLLVLLLLLLLLLMLLLLLLMLLLLLVTCSKQNEMHHAYKIKSFHLDAEMMRRFDRGGNRRQR